MNELYYTGIGSRRTPLGKTYEMTIAAQLLENASYILRSGGAQGADSAFEQGVRNFNNKEIYLPYKNFNGKKGIILPIDSRYDNLVYRTHPIGKRLSSTTLPYHRRNCCQILGLNLDKPSKFILCWTPDGSTGETSRNTGGTGQAIRIAKLYNIPIINMKNDDWKVSLLNIVNDKPTL